MVTRGEVDGEMCEVMEIEEFNCCDKHQEMYGSVESLYCTPEINKILNVRKISFRETPTPWNTFPH